MKIKLASRSLLLVTLASAVLAGCGGGGGGGKSDSDDSGPVIGTQPTSTSVAAGGAASFQVVAATTGTATYQWYRNSEAVPGATSATYTIATVTTARTGTYFCRVTDSSGSTDTAKVTLSIVATGSPVITTQPKSLTVAVGGEATFSVVATGDDLTYQWLKGGTAIDGATEATYTISPVASDSNGSYSVRITNGTGSVTSSAATLTLASTNAPVITSQPRSRAAAAGSSTTFSVTATGTGLTYQWYRGTTAISGATSASYTIPSVNATSAGDYSVVVTNANGSVTSATATLTVSTLPTITAQPTSQSAYVGKPVTFSVTATGADLTYQWYKGATPISGATGQTYTIASVTINDAGSYRVVVSNAAGNVSSNVASLTILDRPIITTPPASTSVGVGAAATFTVSANGSGGLTYQWYKNGVAISGATGTSYTTPAETYADNGAKFTVGVTNPAGTTTSAEATLTVLKLPTITTQPTATSVAAGATAVFSVVATVDPGTLTYQWYRDNVLITGANGASYTTPATTTSDNGAKFYVMVYNSGVSSAGTKSAIVTLTVQ